MGLFLLQVLIHFAKMGGLSNGILLSKVINENNVDKELSENINRAIESGYLRKVENENPIIFITPTGLKYLEKAFQDLTQIFAQIKEVENSDIYESISIGGIVEGGLGEAARYIAMEAYSKRFQSILDFTPFPGTLNVKMINLEDKENWKKMLQSVHKIIPKFDYDGKCYGAVYIWNATLFEPKALSSPQVAIIRPFKTQHTDVFEVISSECLRIELNLKNGSEIRFRVLLPY